ncbi:hypothetical protein [Rothia sp. ZJ932]|uniref:hypothetical protein n=1 Tax=Rothia sp. ZJ932 TaxID=2810516 RepID=UPI001966D222|nr:hypothetical protein [Rothia sp. ZJ932]QRZ61128.1 hypothetical protein JR346_07690 [Rothia sp. ZJ932]
MNQTINTPSVSVGEAHQSPAAEYLHYIPVVGCERALERGSGVVIALCSESLEVGRDNVAAATASGVYAQLPVCPECQRVYLSLPSGSGERPTTTASGAPAEGAVPVIQVGDIQVPTGFTPAGDAATGELFYFERAGIKNELLETTAIIYPENNPALEPRYVVSVPQDDLTASEVRQLLGELLAWWALEESRPLAAEGGQGVESVA